MLRAERDLARARLAGRDGDPAARQRSPPRSPACASTAPPTTSPTACSTTPSTCSRMGDADAAAAAIGEARDIASRLRCQPLLDRAEAISTEPGLIRMTPSR